VNFLFFRLTLSQLNPSLVGQFQFTFEFLFSLGEFSLCNALWDGWLLTAGRQCGLIYVFLMSPRCCLAIVSDQA